jgi:hypothetical protein
MAAEPPLHSKYIEHLRAQARGSSFASTASAAWVCPLCSLASTQRQEEAFFRHLEQLHGSESEERSKISPSSLELWKAELKRQAFAAPTM